MVVMASHDEQLTPCLKSHVSDVHHLRFLAVYILGDHDEEIFFRKAVYIEESGKCFRSILESFPVRLCNF